MHCQSISHQTCIDIMFPVSDFDINKLSLYLSFIRFHASATAAGLRRKGKVGTLTAFELRDDW